MKQLTQEQAERCARACGCGWEAYDITKHRFVCNSKGIVWTIPDSDGMLIRTDSLPLDPYFWFPRLWEVAGARYWDEQAKALIVSAGPLCMVHASSWDGPNVKKHEYVTEANSPCLALCAAIEALEEKCPK